MHQNFHSFLNAILEFLAGSFVRATLFVAFIIIQWLMMRYTNTIKNQKGEKVKLLDTKWKYDQAFIQNYLLELGPEGRKKYHFFSIRYDSVYPVIYALFLISWLLYLVLNLHNDMLIGLTILPASAAVFDYFENSCIRKMLRCFPEISNQLIKKTLWFTRLKWIYVLMSILLILVLQIMKWAN